ncbi:phosphonate C-P lyase system protein PhnH [Rhizobium sp. SSA_523]|uniref:phosphonate C-P lyase system protein PhnH n=1 Tax=Rhizobium sp. SSA_523 TaxID=2952477 RepID=UPI00209047ED|nr:phosphonate C-P lyase system protein PhnH [Rhizobium sp. SSA_523]MCO5733207.1 phosphonate C-P lyase system protein PhnH [Rhizobium sp. SSA_523]WKC21803.1 phosphonate C-P lyase system protein PhnH [Rhizobium sp. SSA_523]
MEMKNQALAGGFQDGVLNSQSVFRALMDCMARPGTSGTVLPAISPPAPLGIAAGALMLTLCDPDTPVWLSPDLARSGTSAWLSFHCGAPLTKEKAEARFAFLETGAVMPPFSLFAAGSQDYPDRSTTLVIGVEALEGGLPLQLTGPGIRETATIAPKGLPAPFLHQWTANRALFPRGIDAVLTAGSTFLCLPRTTKITALEV